jgi:parallel beta-helix repeat protein
MIKLYLFWGLVVLAACTSCNANTGTPTVYPIVYTTVSPTIYPTAYPTVYPIVYYVDNSCANNGDGQIQSCASSPGAPGPFNALSLVQSVVVGDQSDNKLLLKKGQIYSGQFTVSAYGTEGHPFTISSYGTGNKPVITGGKDNMMINCAHCEHIVVDGLEFARPERYGIFISYPAGNVTIRNSYIHDAISAIKIYNSSNNIIDTNETSWNISEGINIHKSVPNHPTTGNIISNNQVHHNLRYGILIQAQPAYPLEAVNTQVFGNESYNNSTGIYLVYSNNIEIYENNLHDNGKDCQTTNDCTGEPYGFAVQSGSYNSFHDNMISRSNNTGIGIYGSQDSINAQSDGNKIYRNVVQDTLLAKWQRDINWQCWPGNSVGNNNQIYNNIFFGEGMNFVIGDSNPSISGNVAFNNIFYGGSTAVYFESTSTNAGWTFKNNIFAGNSDQSIYASRRSDGLTLQNNIYYKDTGGTLIRYNAISYTNANIRSVDYSAITSDPKFAGTAHWNDFRLQAGSPAIDSGVNLGNTYALGFDPSNTTWPLLAINQNEFGTGWEIGPFIYKSDTVTPISTSLLISDLPTSKPTSAKTVNFLGSLSKIGKHTLRNLVLWLK